MIFVSVDSLELYLRIMLSDSLNSGDDEGLDASIDDLASVFGRKDNVVVTRKDTVRFVAIYSWHQAL